MVMGVSTNTLPETTPHLIVSRSRTDKAYLEWQAAVFQELLRPRGVFDFSVYDERTKKTYLGNGFESRSLPELLPWRQRWYPEGKKRVPRDLVLDPLKLAIWFADDGSIMPVSPTSPSRLQLKLSTHGFPEEDVRFLARLLNARYDRSFRVHSDSGNWYIAGSERASRALAAEIDAFLPLEIDRKAYWRKPLAQKWPWKNDHPRISVYLSSKGAEIAAELSGVYRVSRTAIVRAAIALTQDLAPPHSLTPMVSGSLEVRVPTAERATLTAWCGEGHYRSGLDILLADLARRHKEGHHPLSWLKWFYGERQEAIQ